MKTSEKGIELIISFEGFCPKATKCLKSEKYYTIGFGHYGKDVKENDTITKSKAIDLLKSDLEKFEKKVNKYSSYNFTQNEYDSLISFCYNVGNIDQLTAKGTRSKKEIADKMLLYCKSGGKVIRGLQKRREKERDLFLKSSTSNFYCQARSPTFSLSSSVPSISNITAFIIYLPLLPHCILQYERSETNLSYYRSEHR